MKKYLPVLYILIFLFFFPVLFKILPYRELKEYKEQPYSTAYYDNQGKLIQIPPVEYGSRKEFTPIKQIPKKVKKAIVITEDKRFYFHHGVDYTAIINAFFQNRAADRIVRGGSTITMQLAKTLNKSNQRTLSRKITDMINAYRLEAKLSKNQILELYINNIYFGHGAYGITSAARTFYNKTLEELSDDEIKVLVTLPRNPSIYSPINHPERCAEAAGVTKTALPVKLFQYPFECPHLIRYLESNPELTGKNTSEYKKGKSEIFLSINLELQNKAEDFLNQAIENAYQSRITNGSVLLLDNETGNVLAWVGNNNFFDNSHSGQVDGILVKNQPGSSMKPFLYALALESTDQEGKPYYLPNSVIADIPMEFGNDKLYIPFNFNNRFNGPVKMRVALASSLNVPAVTILDKIGVDNYLNFLNKLKFESLKENGYKADLGLALGAGEVRLIELVPAFSIFARDGKYLPVNFINKGDRDKCLFPVIQEDTSRIIDSFLSDKSSRALGFGYTQTFQTEYPSIFKTGTSNQYQDIVALGATKEYTIGVWMGNFSGNTVIGKTGSSLPAWVAKNMLDYLVKGKTSNKSLSFDEPMHYTKARICSLSGMLASKNCPSSVYEYIPDSQEFTSSMEIKECTWHKLIQNQISTIYPPEYQQWSRINNVDVEIGYKQMPLKFQTPKNNALFYYSQKQKDRQAIPVEVLGGQVDTLTIEYDGTFYKTAQRPFSFSLPVEPGLHSVKITCGNETQTLSFTVK